MIVDVGVIVNNDVGDEIVNSITISYGL
jgi:hypothetical protein